MRRPRRALPGKHSSCGWHNQHEGRRAMTLHDATRSDSARFHSPGSGSTRPSARAAGFVKSSLFQRRMWLALCLLAVATSWLGAQTVTSSIQGRVYDTTGAAIPDASVTAANTETGVSHKTTASATGDYQIELLPPGEYMVTAEKSGFQKSAKKVHLVLGAAGIVDFNLSVGQVTQEVAVQDVGDVAEPTRTMVSSAIDEQKIQDLPVNGRQFSDFALLAPWGKIGD